MMLAVLALLVPAHAAELVVQDLPESVVLVQGQSLVLAASPGLCAWTLDGIERRQGAARPLRVLHEERDLLVGAAVADRLELTAVAPGEAWLQLQRRCQEAGGRQRSLREKSLIQVVSAAEAETRGPARITGRIDLGRDGALPRGTKARVAAVAGGQPVPAVLEPAPPQLVGLTRVDLDGRFSLDLPPGAHAVVVEVEGRVIWADAVLRKDGPLVSGVVLGPGQEREVDVALPASLMLDLRR